MVNLRVAGPTPLYAAAYKALQREMITHRGSKYQKLHKSIIAKLRPFFGTNSPHIYLLTSSGTGAMEAAIVNLHNPGDTILSFPVGGFGKRWHMIAESFGANVIKTEEPMGTPVNLNNVKQVMKKEKHARSTLVTFCETSSTVVNDVRAFAKLARTYLTDALVMVDAISLLGASEMNMDKWGIDVVVTGSQKSWGAPPGIAMLALSKKAFKRVESATMGRFYFDLRLFEKYGKKFQTPTTPAVGNLYGLEAALETMHKEGLANVFGRHIKLRDRFRRGVVKLGLKLLVPDEYASPSITAIIVPDGIDASDWLTLLKTKYNTVVSGGKGELTGKVIRVAHMGNVTAPDIDTTLRAIEESLKEIEGHNS